MFNMWIFTKHGFFSVVCAHGKEPGSIDPELMMVRARVKGHLEALKARFPARLGKSTIIEGEGTDYAYRIIVRKSDWTRLAEMLANEVDYANFKGKVAAHQNKPLFQKEDEEYDYVDALHDVWSVMRGLQEEQQ